jgi:hypothetical protein
VAEGDECIGDERISLVAAMRAVDIVAPSSIKSGRGTWPCDTAATSRTVRCERHAMEVAMKASVSSSGTWASGSPR